MDKLTSPTTINEIKKRYEFYFNKRYGQNFLIDANIIRKIIHASKVTAEDVVLEIGPGIGTLTQYLCENAFHVIAVEIDKNLIPILDETLGNFTNKSIVNNDILKVDINALFRQYPGKKAKVIANLPYYITTEVIMLLLEGSLPIESITVMVQKEVAERMIAPPGKKDYGALSVGVQYYSKPEIIAFVPKTVFVPQPNVESCIIKLNILTQPPVSARKEDFFKVVKSSFSMRRKTILNCLVAGLNLEKKCVEEILEKSQVEPSRRGETLSLEEFSTIANHYREAKDKSL